jgi:hypothetical protein
MKETLIKVILIICLIGGILFLTYSAGESVVQAKWDVEKAKMEKEISDLKTNRQLVNTKVVTKYVTRTNNTANKSSSINSAVTKYVPPTANTGCIIPKNIITLFDASVTNTEIPEEFQFKLKMDEGISTK